MSRRGIRVPGQARRRRHSRNYVEEAQRRQGSGGPANGMRDLRRSALDCAPTMRNGWSRWSRWLRRRWLPLAVLAAVAGGAGAWFAVRGGAAKHAPLLVIGIDGGEWRVMHRMWRDGELPHLRRLADRGT